MFQFSYKLRIAERVKATCERHPRYNPERDGREGIKGGCATCFSLCDPRLCPSGLPAEGSPLDTNHQIPQQEARGRKHWRSAIAALPCRPPRRAAGSSSLPLHPSPLRTSLVRLGAVSGRRGDECGWGRRSRYQYAYLYGAPHRAGRKT